jgi:fatty acid desaturase
VWILAALHPSAVLAFYTIAMLLGQCLTSFFAVWTVHHDVDLSRTFARTERGWRNTLFLGMFYHLEHHLFPRVPTPHLRRLAARLDRVRPDLARTRVLP